MHNGRNGCKRSDGALADFADFGSQQSVAALVTDAAINGSKSVSRILPDLHAIGSTRVCIDFTQPQKKQYFWRGQSDGVWLMHRLIRNVVDPLRAAPEPCGALGRGIALPQEGLHNGTLARGGALRDAAMDILKIPREARTTYPEAQLRKRLERSSPIHANFLVRRRLAPRGGSVVVQGDRANLDSNVDTCPSHRALVGCKSPPYDAPYLGAFMPLEDGASEWSETIPSAPPFKYCRSIGSGRVKPSASRRIPGVAVLLPEKHGNLNVGHQVKDLVFLTHMLAEETASHGTNRSFTISTILVDDLATATGNQSHKQALKYRKAAIHALVAGHEPPIHVAFIQQTAHPHKEDFGRDPPWQGAKSVCFDVLLQKGFAYPGDWRGAQFFRERVYASCGIPADESADTVLVIVHGTASNGQVTRRWADQDGLIASLTARSFRTRWCGPHALRGGRHAGPSGPCPPLKVLVRAMEGLSFCEQAALFARARVVVTHHGAVLANGYFMRKHSLMVELNMQWRPSEKDEKGLRFAHLIENAGYASLFTSSHLAYIGAHVTYGEWRNTLMANNGQINQLSGRVEWQMNREALYRFYDPNMAIGINQSRWSQVLDLVDEMVIDLGRLSIGRAPKVRQRKDA